MNFKERQQILRRIISGKFYGDFVFQGNEYKIIFNEPSLDISVEADYIYKKTYDNGKLKGIPTLEDTYQLLIDRGIWSKKYQWETDILLKDIKVLQDNLSNLQYKKREQKSTIQLIENSKKRIIELENIKHQLWSSTLEYLSDKAKKRF